MASRRSFLKGRRYGKRAASEFRVILRVDASVRVVRRWVSERA